MGIGSAQEIVLGEGARSQNSGVRRRDSWIFGLWTLDFGLYAHVVSAVFRYNHRVTYSECTLGNHVYYSRYLELLEAARGEFFRHLGTTLSQWQELDTIFPVIECHLRYKVPARYDDVLKIEVWVTAAKRVRLNFGYRVVTEDGRHVLDAETYHACTNLKEKPKRLPEGLVKVAARFVAA